jgi:hypothetical protein
VPDFISNQRKTLRLRLRCAAQVEIGDVHGAGQTEDVSSAGCRLITDQRLEPGMTLRLRLEAPGTRTRLEVSALVVWTSSWPGNRHGLAFAVDDRPRVHFWFDSLLASNQDLLFEDRVPDRVPFVARVYVGQFRPAQLGDEEEVVLRIACSQTTLRELRERLGPDWGRAQRAFFALLTRGVLTLDAAQAGDPTEWVVFLGARKRANAWTRLPN